MTEPQTEQSGPVKRPSGAPLVPGTQGYAQSAAELIARYRRVSSAQLHRVFLPLMPPQGCRSLDIGAGVGNDARWLTSMGHRVTAVEPVREFREAAAGVDPSAQIEWIDDSLPRLTTLRGRPHDFGLVLLSAVWMHLDAAQRRTAMAVVASLLAPGGLLLITLRHGGTPPGRRMFDVTAAETIALARSHRLDSLLVSVTGSYQQVNRQAGITWSRLAFCRRR